MTSKMAEKKAKKDADNLAAVLDKIPQMFGDQAATGLRLHQIIMEAAPELKPRLWYGMPGYAKAASKPVLLFIRRDDYLTFGLTEKAKIFHEPEAAGQLIPNAWFMRDLDVHIEAQIADIVRKAVS